MVRKFLTLDGEILEETEWTLNPTTECFYCAELIRTAHPSCPVNQGGYHEYITLVNPSEYRR